MNDVRQSRLRFPQPLSGLRGRVFLLAFLAVCLLFITLGVLLAVLRNTQAALVGSATRHLLAVDTELADAYETRTDRSITISHLPLSEPVATGPPSPPRNGPPPEGPPPPPHLGPETPPPAPPLDTQRRHDPLAALTAQVLRSELGIEGGFFDRAADRLGGYAFPTHEGPGPRKEMPLRERPTIQDLSRRAAQTGKAQTSHFVGPHDVVLFVAVPLCEQRGCTGGRTGAAWLIQRLPGAEAERRRGVLWSALAFGGMALLLVTFSFVILSEVDSSVKLILGQLSALESSLEPRLTPNGTPRIREFRRILQALDRLAGALKTRIESERTLESKLRHSERLAAVGQFAAGIAHELRNPLATIRLRVEMLEGVKNSSSATKHASVALAEIDRLNSIIDRLLTFSRPLHLHTKTTDLAALCRETVERWSSTHHGNGIEICFKETAPAVCTVDESRIRQVLDNLIQNAVQALSETDSSPHIRAVEVQCLSVAGEVILHVSDSGPGLTPQALTHALDPFFTTRQAGTGLGLSLAYETVQAHGGQLTLKNRPEGGMVAEVALPCDHGLKGESNGFDPAH